MDGGQLISEKKTEERKEKKKRERKDYKDEYKWTSWLVGHCLSKFCCFIIFCFYYSAVVYIFFSGDYKSSDMYFVFFVSD